MLVTAVAIALYNGELEVWTIRDCKELKRVDESLSGFLSIYYNPDLRSSENTR